MDVNFWTIREANHRLIGEIRLEDRTFVDGDFAMKRRARTREKGSFDLCTQSVGIDGHSHFDSGQDAIGLHISVTVHRDLGDVADDGLEALDDCSSAPAAHRQLRSPSGISRGQQEDGGVPCSRVKTSFIAIPGTAISVLTA